MPVEANAEKRKPSETKNRLMRDFRNRCGYCQSPIQNRYEASIDHYYPLKLFPNYKYKQDNEILACQQCNMFKGDKAPVDENGVQQIFNPRIDKFSEHYSQEKDGTLLGLTEVGKRTISALHLNSHDHIRRRFQKIEKASNTSANIHRSRIQVRDRDDIDGVLGVKELAFELANIVDGLACEDGRMIGIFGSWGRGKTFFAEELFRSLSQLSRTTVIRFRPWKYQDTPALWAYLYENISEGFFSSKSVVTRLKRHLSLNIDRIGIWAVVSFFLSFSISAFWTCFFPFEAKIDSLTNLVAFFGIGTIFHAILLYLRNKEGALKFFERIRSRPTYQGHLGIQAEVQKEIAALLRCWKRFDPDLHIVLFIDDIDRCEETKVIQIVDSLRVMLDDQGISKDLAVIAAIDDRVLRSAILKKLVQSSESPRVNGSRDLVREYIDKIFLMSPEAWRPKYK